MDYRNRPAVDAPRIMFLNRYTVAGALAGWALVGGVGYALAVVAGVAW